MPGAAEAILAQLAACSLLPDETPLWQSQRNAFYRQALDRLVAQGDAYPCACSRKDIEAALVAQGRPRERHAELVYPGTCREGLHGRPARAWRFRVEPGLVAWTDRRLGPQSQDVEHAVGDFVLRRADGLWAYQLAVVVDDGAQGITHVVRGEDLTDNTARQLQLQQALDLPRPAYLHTPLVLGPNGEKLSKQNGAAPLQLVDPVAALAAAASVLGLDVPASGNTTDWLARAVAAWQGTIGA